ncbi:MAG: hypothetical protein CME31_27970 [Gimesia sp.]|uniref:Uncharacterized protein n=1 Tax=Gimesia maris TaxID=122 RepID=A0A3D3R1V4_9PLAN|nr:hypothetical protein [Gimesia sp.]HCO21610.1 hypothetical protein [Gimesia maris]|tara:strand:- start:7255 stop:9066 length:1812 start_codon:yes stop_codon:yes gene_type:complete
MPVELVPESDLRAALQPHRVDASEFTAGVQARLEAGEEWLLKAQTETAPPLLTVAAAFIPWPILSGSKVAGGGVKFSSLTMSQKLLGYIALPAISLFVLVGAAFFSAVKIRKVQASNHTDISDEKKIQSAVKEWWRCYKWFAYPVYGAVIILPMIGSTWLLFLLLLGSFGLLVMILSSLARRGVGNRLIIAQSCLMGLAFLAQTVTNPFTGLRDIHFVDQKLIAVVFYLGTLILIPIIIGCKNRLETSATSGKTKGSMPAAKHTSKQLWIGGVIYFGIVLALLIWITNPILRPATPARILQHVEAFEVGRFPFISWRDWEIPASWAIDEGLNPNFTRARKVLHHEIDTDQPQLTMILGSASRVGMVQPYDVERLPELERKRRSLLPLRRVESPGRIFSLNQYAWVFYTLAQSDQLTSEDRDYLEQRLIATLDATVGETANVLVTALRVTQLLEVIDRPIDRDKYRPQIHKWLLEFHSDQTHFFQIAGGFEQYKDSSATLETTSHAVELMQIYGVPENLDLNQVRSFLRPLYFRPADDKWTAAVTLRRLNSLPGVSQPAWLEWLYYERSLLAAMLLVALCLYATLSSPLPRKDNSGTREDSALG